MPPRRAKATRKAVDPAVAAAKAEWEALHEEVQALSERKQTEDLLFNQFQQQKDRISHFWLLSKKEIEEKKSQLRNRERELQDLDEKNAVEIKIYKQRIKHLLFEQQAEVAEARTQGIVSLKLAQDEHRDSETELARDQRALQASKRDAEMRHAAHLKEVRQKHDEKITHLRLEFERVSRELCARYEDKLDRVRKELFEARELDVRRIEARKAQHINALIKAHERAFQDLKNYYNEITHSNLDMIKSLKEEVNELAKKEAADERRIVAIAQENKRMSAPLAKALEESKRLRAERDRYLQELEELNSLKAKLLVQEDAIATLQWEHEILQQRLERLQKDRDALRTKFTEALYEAQQKVGFRGLLLERKLDAAQSEAEKKEAALGEVLAAANVEGAAASQVEARLNAMVSEKDAVIFELQTELHRVTDAHSTALDSYRGLLAEYGVPWEELGFEPVRLQASSALAKSQAASRAATAKASSRAGGAAAAAASLASPVPPAGARSSGSRPGLRESKSRA